MGRTVLAVDPGRSKCGLALVNDAGPQFRAIVPTEEIGLTCYYLLRQYPGAEVIVGEGTGTREIVAAIRHAVPDLAVTQIPEGHSTLRARKRYFCDQPTAWWQRLLPAGMRVPPRPVDDYAAVVLAEAYLRSS